MSFPPLNVPGHDSYHEEAERRVRQTFGNFMGPGGGTGPSPFGGLYDGPSTHVSPRDPYAPLNANRPNMAPLEPVPMGPLSTSSRSADAARVGQHLPDRPSARPPLPIREQGGGGQPDMVFTPREVGIPGATGPDMVFTPSEVEQHGRRHHHHHRHHGHGRGHGPDMVFTEREAGIPNATGPDMVITPAEVAEYERTHR